MRAFINDYYTGLRTNGRKEAKYQREVKKAQSRAAKGKDYKVAAATTIDLQQVKVNIINLMQHLKDHYEERNAADPLENKRAKTDRITDYLKENASGMVLKVTKQMARNKALKLMEEVGISEPRKRYRQYPFEFSGGMRQRIVIAIALAANPDILICDEPTTALDVTIQAQILELINNLKRERNLSIIFITHDLGVVANMADRIAVMYAGKIVEYGTSEEIFYDPQHPYTWALLSSMPDLDSKDALEAIPGTPPDMRFPPVGDAFAERNRYAMKIDFEKQPPQFPVSDTHWAATWLLHPDAPKVEPPKAVTERITKMKARMEGEANG
ncbi:MAG: ABC transporter ATP-binding protein [Clostridia bacterium]|nr:ABC transporter ATP-binding protein [Clostridia bacterium]